MTYDPNIPKANQTVASSQPGIQSNFNIINDATRGFAVDHVSLTNATDGGKHNKCTFPAQAADPAALANTIILYSKKVGTVTDLYYREATGDGGNVVKLTTDSTPGVPVNALFGRSFMPGGIIVQWGRSQINNGQTTKTVSFIAPGFSNVWSITATPINISGSTIQDNTPAISGMTGASFVLNRRVSSGNVSFNWIAIGS